MKKSKIVALVMVLVLIASSFIACGGDDGDSKGGKGLSIKIDGKSYKFNTESFLTDFPEIDGLAIMRNTPKGIDYYGYEEGKPDDDLDVDDVRILYRGDGLASPIGINTSSVVCDNDYRLFARDFTFVAERYDERYDNVCGVYSMSFVNDYNFDGITPSTKAKDLEKKGFNETYLEDVYYKVYSSDYNYKEVYEQFEELCDDEVSHAKINSDLGKAFDGCLEYILASSLDPRDFMRFDMGFGEQSEKAINHQSTRNMVEEPFEPTRMLTLSIADQIMKINDGDIDYSLIVIVDQTDMADAQYNGNILRVFMLTDIDNIKSWPEEWDWEPMIVEDAPAASAVEE